MKITTELKKRFCKDCNIPINIFKEPYFMERIGLYDKLYGTIEKWNLFLKELENYETEQDYFEEYNRVKDNAIDFIKNSEAYQHFNQEDMNKYAVVNKDISSKDIYKETNVNKMFISIDMKKANFSSLRYYSKSVFDGSETWEEFISKFTSNKHIINSKYIRQVILGNCNCGRQIPYEKYLMDTLINTVLYPWKDLIVSFSNDEIVLEASDSLPEMYSLQSFLNKKHRIPFKVEYFKLHKINGTSGYYKEILKENGETEIKLKCLDSLYLPFVLRLINKEEIQENDKVFYHNGLLAKFIEVPDITIEGD